MATELTAADFARAAAALRVEEAVVRAVVEVEAGGSGFLPDGRPKILYEAHVFDRLTKGQHRDAKDRRDMPLSSPKWDRSLYGASGAHQWDRLEHAARRDWDAAHKACSWGAFQLLGENHAVCGYPDIAGFVEAMRAGAGEQLDAFVAFIRGNNLDTLLRRREWANFARRYNGPSYAQNKYDTKLAGAYRKYAAAATTV